MSATATTASVEPTAQAGRVSLPDQIRRQLTTVMPDSEAKSWLWVGIVGLIAAVLRLVSLAYPDQIIFDETYYANEAHSLLSHGAEWDLKEDSPKFVVHPPLGKWLIAIGIKVFGFTSFGWRVAAAVAGVASVIILARLGRRLFRSTALGCVAGLLLALDGMHFVSSRTALLDIYLMVFILASFACLVRDREAARQRWLHVLQAGWTPDARLPSTPRGWRIAAAVLAGCALAVKWSALWYIVLFLVLIAVWDHSTMRAAGVPARARWGSESARRAAGWALGFGAVVMTTYLASWSGWFADDGASHRHWLRDQGYAEWPVLGALYNWFQYHAAAYEFHTTLVDNHQYQSWPWQWLLLGRPVAYYWSDQGPCGAEHCAAEVLLLGTPLLWWSFIPALIAVFWQAMSRRDWRAWAILAGSAMGIVPWFLYQLDDRTMFYFYALPSAPFLVLAVTMALGMIIGPAHAHPLRRRYAAIGVATYIVLVGICFWYFYPIYTGEPLPYEEWRARMWLDGLWI